MRKLTMSAASIAAVALLVLAPAMSASAVSQTLGARNCGDTYNGISSVTTGIVTHRVYTSPSTSLAVTWAASGTWKSRANQTVAHTSTQNIVTAATTIHLASTSCTFTLP